MFLLTRKYKAIKLAGDILSPLVTAKQSPIYLIGIPRSGTTWITSILSTAPGIKCLFEPFHSQLIPASVPYKNKYFRGEDRDEAFTLYFQNILRGKINNEELGYLGWIYKQLPWWPSRILIKDVNTTMALDWIAQHINPIIVIVMRHPCAVALSRFRLFKREPDLDSFLQQPKLMDDYLAPFESVMKNARGLWQKTGAFWGASYYVMLEQKKQHANWLLVQHETLCQEPEQQYRQLFEKLNLQWTPTTNYLLNKSITKNSNKPFIPVRISSQEHNKWQKELDPDQIKQVKEFAQPFGIPGYLDC